jgi:hypothetical protein
LGQPREDESAVLKTSIRVLQLCAHSAGPGVLDEEARHLSDRVAHRFGIWVQEEDKVGRGACSVLRVPCLLRALWIVFRVHEAQLAQRQIVAAGEAEIVLAGV